MATFPQLVRVALVHIPTLALAVRSTIASDAGTFIPIQSEPAQTVIDGLERWLGITRVVRILDAQDERASISTREEPVEERRARPTDVQIARGGRGKANSERAGTHRAAQAASHRGNPSSICRPCSPLFVIALILVPVL